MQFLLYSEIDEGSIRDKLGMPEYSYYFVLKTFRHVFERLGNVTTVQRPLEEVDPIYEACAERGEPCIFVCFSQPTAVPLGLKCPTTIVFAWEFTTLPDGAWDPGNPSSDWHYVLRQLGHAICLSGHTARVVKAEMGDAFPVFAIACAVWDRVVADGGAQITGPQIAPRTLRMRGTIIDTAALTLAPELVGMPGFPPSAPIPEPPPPDEPPPHETLTHEPLAEPTPEMASAPGLPPPMSEPEPLPPDELPLDPEPEHAEQQSIAEPVAAAEPPRGVRYRLAAAKRRAVEWYRENLREQLPRPLRRVISRLGVSVERLYRASTGRRSPAPDGPDLSPEPEAPPQAEAALELEALPQAEAPEPGPPQETGPAPEPAPEPVTRKLTPEVSVEVGGIIYTSVLNPVDGRKNWPDILTAFCWAFRDVSDATLILKMVRSEAYPYAYELYIALARLAPFKCRVVILQGFLEEAAYAELMAATSFYVNASSAEGLCLPLMEFMAVGKPAIAPRHTALEDYIDPSVAFVVGSSPEHNIWPNDPRKRFRTMRERIHWDTLVQAYEESYRVAKTDEPRYRAMATRASEIIRDYSADAVIRERLRIAVDHMPARADAAQAADDGSDGLLEAAAQ